jgi:hypothetical protein
MKKSTAFILTALLLLSAFACVLAQDQAGTISGIVYRDLNANGICASEGEPVVADNIPIEIISDDAGELIRISSAVDGSFFYTTDALGLWRVTVVPGQGWRITSQQTLEVVLSVDNPDASNIDFCIIEIEQTEDGAGNTLPESGSIVAPTMLLAAISGLILILIGAGLLLFSRHSGS